MQSRLSSIVALTFFLTVLGLVLWFGIPEAQNTSRGDRVFVVTTTYPLADFAQNVGGDFVYVSNIVPAGSEPHDYEPTPREVAQVLEADVLLYVGNGFDAWAEDMNTDQNGESVSISEVVALEEISEGTFDPHAWLDPVLAQDIVLALRDALSAADPVHAEQYAANAATYVELLVALDQDYAATLRTCDLDDIIVSHDAFGYLARRYDFTIHAIAGSSPEAEPSVRDLSDLANTARDLDVTTIFFETLVSPELAETLAKEVGADTAVLNPLEGLSESELEAGQNYLSIMQQNREALSSAMLCQ